MWAVIIAVSVALTVSVVFLDLPAHEVPLMIQLLTTSAVGQLTEVHERMPLVLPQGAWAHWLDPDEPDVSDLLRPPPLEVADSLEVRPVSTAVNNVRNNGPQLLDPVEPEANDGRQKGN